jgi:hypothetical protein
MSRLYNHFAPCPMPAPEVHQLAEVLASLPDCARVPAVVPVNGRCVATAPDRSDGPALVDVEADLVDVWAAFPTFDEMLAWAAVWHRRYVATRSATCWVEMAGWHLDERGFAVQLAAARLPYR